MDGIGFVRNAFVQFVIFGFTSLGFLTQITLQLIGGFMDGIGFVGNPFIQFVVSCFTACHFVVVGSSQRCNAIGCVLVHLLDDCILGFVSPDPGGGFFGQSSVQVGDVFANGVGRFHNGPILYGRISLAYIIIRCLFFQILLHIGDPGIQRRIGRLTSRSFVINIGLQLFIRIFQIGNRIFALSCFFFNGIGIGFGLRIEGNDIFAYRIAGRYIIPAGKGIIHDALHADDFIFSGNIGLGNHFFGTYRRLRRNISCCRNGSLRNNAVRTDYVFPFHGASSRYRLTCDGSYGCNISPAINTSCIHSTTGTQCSRNAS